MKCEEVKINLPEYIDGKLDKDKTSEVENHLQNCPSCNETYKELNSFLRFTGSFPEIEPPKGMKEEFMLLAEPEENNAKVRMIIPEWVKVAAVLILVFGTFAAGYFTGSGSNNSNELMAEVNNLKQQVLLAGLRDYTGPQKIEAVYNVANTGDANADLVNALVFTLNSDKNANVRLAALNVLSGMIETNNTVKNELIKSLRLQDEPLLQISLIQVLTQSGVKEAKDDIENLSNKTDVDPNVKSFAKDMVKTII